MHELNNQKLIIALYDYIKFLGNEIDSLAPIASLHGWKSSRVEEGRHKRKIIKELGGNL